MAQRAQVPERVSAPHAGQVGAGVPRGAGVADFPDMGAKGNYASKGSLDGVAVGPQQPKYDRPMPRIGTAAFAFALLCVATGASAAVQIDLKATKADWIAWGANVRGWLGWDVQLANLNGDGDQDVILEENAVPGSPSTGARAGSGRGRAWVSTARVEVDMPRCSLRSVRWFHRGRRRSTPDR